MELFRKLGLLIYSITGIAVISTSHFLVQLFSQTIPGVFYSFFRGAGEAIILAAVFAFAISWLLRARPHSRPKSYSMVVFDVFGNETKIDGIRTEFKTHDVGWSFMKQYKQLYPLNNFALVSHTPKSTKPTIFRYI
ncbi:MAG: hypothetical protein GWN01_06630 [Nitrosopumilaceae archaeon]|nr:hypothetical protein [Nitrosopumilaceae archaeon]NIU00610.1 hypothetical protein [Nitrosopumilaceae archaeon]NIU86996.1 hypothetical protein [Nitrosopumilaceae archaeon]NIV66460.1 hypothetical protein [Nitrosopumilaceae archaeon]NIX61212.1 hypothetical protein [Nitrosopumilaceae archaeon]